MKKILLILATLIPSITPTFVKNTNIQKEISTINKPTKNQFKIEFDPDPLVGVTYDDPDHEGEKTDSKDTILLKWSDMAPTLQDFIKLFPHITVNFNLKVDMYSRPHGKHQDAYNNNGVFNGDTENLFNYKTAAIDQLDSHTKTSTTIKNFATSSISTVIDSDNRFHLILEIVAGVRGACAYCWEIEAETSISSVIFSS